MISIEQWRAAVGNFRAVITYGCSMKHDHIGVPATRIFVLSVLWCSFVVGIVCLYNVSKFLVICSNDVEQNPGPVVYKLCPNCGNKAVHIKRKICPCGYIFRKKSDKRSAPSIPLSTSDVIDGDINVATTTSMHNKDRDIVTADISSNSGKPTVAEDIVVDNDKTFTSVVDASDIMSGSIDDNVVDNTIKSARVVNTDNIMSASVDSVNAEHVNCTQSNSGEAHTIRRWDKYKTVINRNRRKKYKFNPECEKSRSYRTYHSNPSPVKHRVLTSYHAHPSPVKQRALESYYAHPSPVKRRALESYYKAHESAKKGIEKSTNFFDKT